jgi:hypothetical protein
MARSKLSRRKFLALVAAGSAVTAADALAAKTAAPRTNKTAAAAAKKAAKPPVYATPPVASAAIARGIAQQKEWLASSLDTIRRFELTPGSEQGFAFRPLPAARRKS